MILIVDDSYHMGESIRHLVSACGYHAQWVGSGRQALAAVQSHPHGEPLLVVLDYMMPDLTGVEVLQELRKSPRMQHVPAIMLSAIFSQSVMKEVKSLGVDTWIVKGADIQGMIQTIVDEYKRVGGTKVRSIQPAGTSE